MSPGPVNGLCKKTLGYQSQLIYYVSYRKVPPLLTFRYITNIFIEIQIVTILEFRLRLITIRWRWGENQGRKLILIAIGDSN
jgi:hypothetical protein